MKNEENFARLLRTVEEKLENYKWKIEKIFLSKCEIKRDENSVKKN